MTLRTNVKWSSIISMLINIAVGLFTYHSWPHWSGACFGCAVWSFSDVVLSLIPQQPEKISTKSPNYKFGWADGWNACRSTEPDNRVFIRTDKIV